MYINAFIHPYFKDAKENWSFFYDKSMIIKKINEHVNTPNNKICVTRPRRFGKSCQLLLLSDYYSNRFDSRSIFSSMKISEEKDWDKYLNRFYVIYIDVQLRLYTMKYSRQYKTVEEYFNYEINLDLQRNFTDLEDKIKIDRPLWENLEVIYEETNQQFIFLFDEYDVLVREKKYGKKMDSFISFMNSISQGGEERKAIALIYLTGIYPILKKGKERVLKNYIESSIINPSFLGEDIGFTEDEVKPLLFKEGISYERFYNKYGGIKIDKGKTIYNALVVSQVIEYKEFKDYWSQTGSYESISDLIEKNIDSLHKEVTSLILDRGKVKVNVKKFKNRLDNINKKDKIYTSLINIGYLAYDKNRKKAYIPNDEVREDWIRALSRVKAFNKLSHRLKEGQFIHFFLLRNDIGYLKNTLAKNLSYNYKDIKDIKKDLLNLLQYTLIFYKKKRSNKKNVIKLYPFPFYKELPNIFLSFGFEKEDDRAIWISFHCSEKKSNEDEKCNIKKDTESQNIKLIFLY